MPQRQVEGEYVRYQGKIVNNQADFFFQTVTDNVTWNEGEWLLSTKGLVAS